MAQPPHLEARIAALEARVSELDERVRRSEQDATAARVLAGGADRDVTEMTAEIRGFREQNTRVLNAMREDRGENWPPGSSTSTTGRDSASGGYPPESDGAVAGIYQTESTLA